MKQIYKIILLVNLVLVVFTINAQEFYRSVKPVTTEGNTLNYKLSGRQYYFTSPLRGSVNFNDFWSVGSVILENGDRYDSVSLMLNIYTEDLIWFNSRTGSLIVLDKYAIKEFILDTENYEKMLFRKIYIDKMPKGEHYFNVFYEGEIKLLGWHRVTEVSTSLYRDFYGYLRDKEYVRQVNYFIMFPNNDIVKISGSKKSFVNLFPEQKKTVRQIFRKNNIYLVEKNRNEILRATKLIETEFFSK
jgi:hypothetical protein